MTKKKYIITIIIISAAVFILGFVSYADTSMEAIAQISNTYTSRRDRASYILTPLIFCGIIYCIYWKIKISKK